MTESLVEAFISWRGTFQRASTETLMQVVLILDNLILVAFSVIVAAFPALLSVVMPAVRDLSCRPKTS
jgi:hypothetical protein